MLTTVLFDLDGTLLPMDLDEFVNHYFGLLTKKLSAHGYDPSKVVDGMWAGLRAMIANDGSHANEDVFFPAFSEVTGRDVRSDFPIFQSFYENEFQDVKNSCGFDPKAAEAVAAIKSKGLRVALATSPLYPAIATKQRVLWAGFQPEDFEICTTYEDFHYSKPNPAYYQEVLDKLGVTAEECLMVGNDVIEDLVAAEVGIKVFLMPRWLINRKNQDISSYPQGDFDDLLQYIDSLMEVK